MSDLAGLTIGFIGLGLMGRPMAANLLRAGATVVGFDHKPEAVEGLVALGMRGAVCMTDAVAPITTGFPILMLPDTPAVESVVTAILPSLQRGFAVVDMGTTRVAAIRELARSVNASGAELVDAPVSGGQVGAERGTLSIMVGSTEATFEHLLPVWRALGQTVTRVGDVGAGQVAKACNQVIVGATIGAVAEALTLARAAGVDPAVVRQALTGGFASSRILELHGARMVARDFEPGGRCTTQRKDMAQALELAEAAGVTLPLTAHVKGMYDALIASGLGSLDHSALIKVVSGEVPYPDI